MAFNRKLFKALHPATPKQDYLVTITENASYELIVKARNEEEACSTGEARFIGNRGIKVGKGITAEVFDRNVAAEKVGEDDNRQTCECDPSLAACGKLCDRST